MKLKSKPIKLQRVEGRGANGEGGGRRGKISHFIYEEFYTFLQCHVVWEGGPSSSTVMPTEPIGSVFVVQKYCKLIMPDKNIPGSCQ